MREIFLFIFSTGFSTP